MPSIKSSNRPNSDTANSRFEMKTKIINYIRAGYPGLYLVSPEEQRVELELKSVAAEMKFKLFVWSVTAGMLDTAKGSVRECNDPLEALLAIRELPDESICVLRDLQMFLGNDANPILVRQFREVLQVAKTKSKTLVVLGCRLALPPELERELTVLEFTLPGKEQLGRVLDGIIESADFPAMAEQDREAALDAAGGLTISFKAQAFPVESSLSFPGGGENTLSVGNKAAIGGEPNWRVHIVEIAAVDGDLPQKRNDNVVDEF